MCVCVCVCVCVYVRLTKVGRTRLVTSCMFAYATLHPRKLENVGKGLEPSRMAGGHNRGTVAEADTIGE